MGISAPGTRILSRRLRRQAGLLGQDPNWEWTMVIAIIIIIPLVYDSCSYLLVERYFIALPDLNMLFHFVIRSLGLSTWRLDLKSICVRWVEDDSHTWVSKEMKFMSTQTFHGVRQRFLRSNSATTRVFTQSTRQTTVTCREMADCWNNAIRLASFH